MKGSTGRVLRKVLSRASTGGWPVRSSFDILLRLGAEQPRPYVYIVGHAPRLRSIIRRRTSLAQPPRPSLCRVREARLPQSDRRSVWIVALQFYHVGTFEGTPTEGNLPTTRLILGASPRHFSHHFSLHTYSVLMLVLGEGEFERLLGAKVISKA